MKVSAWLGCALFLISFATLACQSAESPVGGDRDRGIRTTSHIDYDFPENPTVDDIAAALDACNDDGTGQGNAAQTRFLNAIDKDESGNVSGAQSDIIGLLDWEYERYDLGKWQCTDENFVEIMTAMVQSVDLNIPIALDGCVCLTDGCTCTSNTDCAGVTLPNPDGEAYFVSFDDIPFDPFVLTPPVLNLYDQWANFEVVDINGNPVEFSGVPATVAVFVQDLNTNQVTEEQLRLVHVKDDGTIEILPPAQSTFSLSCTDASTASNSFFDQVASIFQVTPLYGAGTKSGLLSSFSPVGPGDPHSDTQVGISPSGVQLKEGQSQTFTATVEGVTTEDTSGKPYTPTPLQAGAPIEFYLDEATVPFLETTIGANGQATATLTCGTELDNGEHVVRVVYPGTATHATSSTADADGPTGPATVTCTLPYSLINFDRDPLGNPLKNGEIVNNTYASDGVLLSRTGGDGTCNAGNAGNVYAVSDPNSGNFGSPPRVVSLCPDRAAVSTSTQGRVVASFGTPANALSVSEVCIRVFPTGKGGQAPQGTITAYAGNTQIGQPKSGQGTDICVKKGRNDPYITRAEFSGSSEAVKFDNLQFR